MSYQTASGSEGKSLIRVRPRGFCAGVVRAVDIGGLALQAYGPPVYVHQEALKFAREDRSIILIGHRDHQEIVGTSGEAPEQTVVVDSVEAVDALEVKDPT